MMRSSGLIVTLWQWILTLMNSSKRKMIKDVQLSRYPRGIRNLGNTCFLSSVLQAFATFGQLEIYFENLVRVKPTPLARLLLKTLQDIRPTIRMGFSHNPSELLKAIISKNPSFQGYDQQDAQELFQTISVIINEEMKRKKQATLISGLRVADDAIDSLSQSTSSLSMSNSNIKVDSESSYTFHMIYPFEGLLASQVVCQKCKHERPVQNESFVNISLPIPSTPSTRSDSSYSQGHKTNGMSQMKGLGGAFMKQMQSTASTSLGQDISLYGCLDAFTSGEYIDDVECSLCTTVAAAKSQREKIEQSSAMISLREKRIFDKLKYLQSLSIAGDQDHCNINLEDEFSNSNLYSSYANVSPGHSVSSNEKDTDRDEDDDDSHSEEDLTSTWSKIRTRVLKKHSFSRLPDILCLHLCRRVYSNTTGQIMKVSRHVNFPIELDMTRYFYFKGSSSGQHPFLDSLSRSEPSIKRSNDEASISTKNASDDMALTKACGFKYTLRAVIVHHGNAESGHYTTYCVVDEASSIFKRKQEARQWMHFSDDSFEVVNESKVLASQAYMLFYSRVK